MIKYVIKWSMLWEKKEKCSRLKEGKSVGGGRAGSALSGVARETSLRRSHLQRGTSYVPGTYESQRFLALLCSRETTVWGPLESPISEHTDSQPAQWVMGPEDRSAKFPRVMSD